jgi:hypothetical protein
MMVEYKSVVSVVKTPNFEMRQPFGAIIQVPGGHIAILYKKVGGGWEIDKNILGFFKASDEALAALQERSDLPLEAD